MPPTTFLAMHGEDEAGVTRAARQRGPYVFYRLSSPDIRREDNLDLVGVAMPDESADRKPR